MKEKTKETLHHCGSCNATLPKENLVEFDGILLCQSCFEAETTPCVHCGKLVWKNDNAGDRNTPLCDSCYEEYYTSCEDCGTVIPRDNAFYYNDYPHCQACYEDNHDNCSIKDYGYKPDPLFFGADNRFFGVELEVDDGGECDDCADSVLRIANRDKTHIYCKHDGSLNEGFEIVTHPMTLDYHLNKMPWADILTRLRTMGYLSHKAETCGLHLHINRTSLGSSEAEQEATIARILYFVEKHWEELLKFSRRTPYQLERWAARYGLKEQPLEILDRAKKGTDKGRYVCVNLQNLDTIEFRMFRGTLKLNTILATLQLVNRICDVAFSLSDDQIKKMSWTTFVMNCEEPELIQYLKERRIYINEPIESEDEI